MCTFMPKSLGNSFDFTFAWKFYQRNTQINYNDNNNKMSKEITHPEHLTA